MLISPNYSFSSSQFEPTVLHRSMPSLQNYPDRVPKRKSKGKTVPLSQRLLSALIIQDGSETTDSIANLQEELSQFSSKYSQRTLDERISLELWSIGLPMDAVVGDQENNDSSHKGGASKAGKQAGLDIANQTGRSCFNELTSSDVVLSEPVCSKDAKSVVLIDTNSVLRAVRTLNHISPIPKRKRTTRGRKQKQSEVTNTTSANAGSSSPRNGRGERKTKTKRKRKMARLSSLGSVLESIKETSPVGVKQKNQKKNTKAKSSAKMKTKAKEKVDQLSASGSFLGSIAETPISSSPSKGESGESVNTGGTGVNEEAGLVFPQDLCLDIDGLSSLEMPDDVESWLVDGLPDEAELYDPAAFLEIPMDDLLDVNLCFRRN